MGLLDNRDIICIIIILLSAFFQIKKIMQNVKNSLKYNDVGISYHFAFMIPFCLLSSHSIKAYILLLYAIMYIVLFACIYVFYFKKNIDTKCVKKDLIICFFLFILVFITTFVVPPKHLIPKGTSYNLLNFSK